MSEAGRKKRLGKQVSHAKKRADTITGRRLRDPFDAMQDYRSEALYADDPSEEPDTREVAEAPFRDPGFVCFVDESAGFRG